MTHDRRKVGQGGARVNTAAAGVPERCRRRAQAEAVCWQRLVAWGGGQLRWRWWAVQGVGWKLQF